MRRGLVLLTFVVGVAALPVVAGADDIPTLGSTTTVECRFDPHVSAGVTTCSQLTVRITGGVCYPAGTLSTVATRLFFHDEFSSSREYRGNAVLSGLNGTPVTGNFGDVPLGGDVAAWDAAIYMNVVRPHARLINQSGVSESEVNSYAVIVDDPSCA
jgi:hypothetical protein